MDSAWGTDKASPNESQKLPWNSLTQREAVQVFDMSRVAQTERDTSPSLSEERDMLKVRCVSSPIGGASRWALSHASLLSSTSFP